MKKPKHNRNTDSAPAIRFTPTAWAKLTYLRDHGDTEVGGFGVSAEDDPLLMEDFQLVEQVCCPVSVRFNDLAVADYFDRQVDRGLKPSRFARIWVHTHPGDSADPSWTDEATFTRVFGATDWSVMFILARGGQTYARLRFNVGPGGALPLPVAVEYGQPFLGSDFSAWDQEYQACVRMQIPPLAAAVKLGTEELANQHVGALNVESWPEAWGDWGFDDVPDFNEERPIYD
jgi:hypothetical protein